MEADLSQDTNKAQQNGEEQMCESVAELQVSRPLFFFSVQWHNGTQLEYFLCLLWCVQYVCVYVYKMPEFPIA